MTYMKMNKNNFFGLDPPLYPKKRKIDCATKYMYLPLYSCPCILQLSSQFEDIFTYLLTYTGKNLQYLPSDILSSLPLFFRRYLTISTIDKSSHVLSIYRRQINAISCRPQENQKMHGRYIRRQKPRRMIPRARDIYLRPRN